MQPSIYPSPHATVTLVESPPPLAAHVRVAREAVTDVMGDAKVQINKAVDRWVKWERVVERESAKLSECVGLLNPEFHILQVK